MKVLEICKVKLTALSKDEFKEYVLRNINANKKVIISKINTEFLVRSIRDSHFRETLNMADMNICDGRGVLWSAKYLSLPISKSKYLRIFQAIWQMIYSGAAIIINPGYIASPISDNIPGVEALMLMLGAAAETKTGVFFFGAMQADLDKAIQNIQKKMPDIVISGSLNGYDYQRDASINPVSIINETGAELLIVAQGSPLQEIWIRENMDLLKNVHIAVGEGGSLAFLAGTFRHAPGWLNKLGLEWLWRLFMNKSLTHQTGSRVKRVWNAVPVFIYEVVRWKVKYGSMEI